MKELKMFLFVNQFANVSMNDIAFHNSFVFCNDKLIQFHSHLN